MKLRPQFNLRLRDLDQFVQFQNIAAAKGISVNEWLLRQAEVSEDVKLSLAEIAGLNRATPGNATATGVATLVKAVAKKGGSNANSENSGSAGRGAAVSEESRPTSRGDGFRRSNIGCEFSEGIGGGSESEHGFDAGSGGDAEAVKGPEWKCVCGSTGKRLKGKDVVCLNCGRPV